MLKLRIIFIASLVILCVLLVFTVFKPMASRDEFSALTRESVIQGEGEFIIQISLINREGVDTNYVINWSTGGEIYNSKKVTIKNGRTFTNIHHIYPETAKEGEVLLTIYKEGETTPLEECTYCIEFD